MRAAVQLAAIRVAIVLQWASVQAAGGCGLAAFQRLDGYVPYISRRTFHV